MHPVMLDGLRLAMYEHRKLPRRLPPLARARHLVFRAAGNHYFPAASNLRWTPWNQKAYAPVAIAPSNWTPKLAPIATLP
jgi:hypothetical protein